MLVSSPTSNNPMHILEDESDFRQFPLEVKRMILIFSGIKEINLMQLVSKSWQGIIENPKFWECVTPLLNSPSIQSMAQLKFHALRIKECAKNSFGHQFFKTQSFKDEFDKLANSWKIEDLNELEEAVSSADSITFLKALKSEVFDTAEIKTLKDLHAKRIEFTTWFQKNITNITLIEELKLNREYLSNLPSEIKLMTNLQSLCIEGCGLMTLSPDIFDSLKKLKKIDLARNNLAFSQSVFEELKVTFSNLKELEYLNLQCNKLTKNQIEDIEKLEIPRSWAS